MKQKEEIKADVLAIKNLLIVFSLADNSKFTHSNQNYLKQLGLTAKYLFLASGFRVKSPAKNVKIQNSKLVIHN
ncbi:hypothetical protein IQ270_23645 [Microcoleus sp. LEGE 07076]|uniref:hypothetical protein n=1 Tax=Microcoleus sp. LEGE 07076 TaxID=915322 RepID=UPI0018824EA2|nr:hypothetical protein [Microcoleus sp. LEGE 07076]MBE9187558.1 hypothetical protein [Microcoleus sp. LEGE 07076]